MGKIPTHLDSIAAIHRAGRHPCKPTIVPITTRSASTNHTIDQRAICQGVLQEYLRPRSHDAESLHDLGGTSWCALAAPVVYTSYDYGAPISEPRLLTPKYYEIKLQPTFLQTATPILLTVCYRVFKTASRPLNLTLFGSPPRARRPNRPFI
jgi:Glycosyl hydrolases family 35